MRRKDEAKLNYGNWISEKFIYIPAALTAVFLGLSFLSLFFLIGAFIFLIPAVYFIYAYLQFSPGGGNVQARIRELVSDQLVWDGDGTLLDIGCGDGALAIEAATKYPKARIVGIDYWGGNWEYSKEACEKNAKIAGVSERTFFEKASAVKLPFTDEYFDAVVSNLVFHNIQDVKDKSELIKEALRVLKKGGVFVFQDPFLWEVVYGEIEDLMAIIESWGIQEVKFVDTSQHSFIPRAMKLPFMVGKICIIHGKK
jgi:SAM-dependent methyltransferase